MKNSRGDGPGQPPWQEGDVNASRFERVRHSYLSALLRERPHPNTGITQEAHHGQLERIAEEIALDETMVRDAETARAFYEGYLDPPAAPE